MNELMYLEYPYLYQAKAEITGSADDERGQYLTLSKTIFYPQGGGQPADQGEIFLAGVVYPVEDVRQVAGEVRHYYRGNVDSDSRGSTVTMSVDPVRRQLNSKFHTAGHLIAVVAEQSFPQLHAIKGHQFPGEAYVEFAGVVDVDDDFVDLFNVAIQVVIAKNLVVNIMTHGSDSGNTVANTTAALSKNKQTRFCQIDGFPPHPCGGTHVRTLQEINSCYIKRAKCRKSKTKIYYEVA